MVVFNVELIIFQIEFKINPSNLPIMFVYVILNASLLKLN